MSEAKRPRSLKLMQLGVTAVILGIAGLVLMRQLQSVSIAAVIRDAKSVAPIAVGKAMLFVMICYTAGGLYEGMMLRTIGKPLGVRRPLFMGIIANSIGHCLGWSVFTGGALRWRLYAPYGVSGTQIAALLPLSAAPFTLGAWPLLGISLLVEAKMLSLQLHTNIDVLRFAAIAALGAYGITLVLLARTGTVSLGRFRISLPSSRLLAIQIITGMLEITVVACALYVLLPASLSLSFVQFLAMYLASVLLGLASTVPAGLGVLEASMVVLLPQIPPVQLIASIALYRLIFEVLPFTLGLLLLLGHELAAPQGWLRRYWQPQLTRQGNSSDA